MQILRLTPDHVAEYREFMLNGYASDPESFASTVAEREVLPLDWWISRVTDQPNAKETNKKAS